MNTSNLKVKVDFFGNEKLMNIFDYDTAKKIIVIKKIWILYQNV